MYDVLKYLRFRMEIQLKNFHQNLTHTLELEYYVEFNYF